MAPTCTNCNGTDFVWANELKTGSVGGGTLSLRTRGEVPLGTRICRACGHAELFLRDVSILHQPHMWRPGEFIPIASKPKPAAPAPHVTHAPPAEPVPVSPPPPPPPPAPMISEPDPMPPPAEIAPEPVAEPVPETTTSPMLAATPEADRPRTSRRKAAKTKA